MAVPTRINSVIYNTLSFMQAGGGVNYVVETPNKVIYAFFIDGFNSDASYSKSLDGGMTWGSPVSIKAGTCVQISVWYDRWSGIDADLIHVVYSDSGNDDVFYQNIDTANSDTISSEHTVFTGASTANGGALSISKMRGGNLIVVGSIDAATEIFSRKSTDVGVNWSDITAGYESGGTADLCNSKSITCSCCYICWCCI